MAQAALIGTLAKQFVKHPLTTWQLSRKGENITSDLQAATRQAQEALSRGDIGGLLNIGAGAVSDVASQYRGLTPEQKRYISEFGGEFASQLTGGNLQVAEAVQGLLMGADQMINQIVAQQAQGGGIDRAAILNLIQSVPDELKIPVINKLSQRLGVSPTDLVKFIAEAEQALVPQQVQYATMSSGDPIVEKNRIKKAYSRKQLKRLVPEEFKDVDSHDDLAWIAHLLSSTL